MCLSILWARGDCEASFDHFVVFVRDTVASPSSASFYICVVDSSAIGYQYCGDDLDSIGMGYCVPCIQHLAVYGVYIRSFATTDIRIHGATLFKPVVVGRSTHVPGCPSADCYCVVGQSAQK